MAVASGAVLFPVLVSLVHPDSRRAISSRWSFSLDSQVMRRHESSSEGRRQEGYLGVLRHGSHVHLLSAMGKSVVELHSFVDVIQTLLKPTVNDVRGL